MKMSSLSSSRKSVYAGCPYRYKLMYHDRVPRVERDTSAADVGTMVHAAFERALSAGDLDDALPHLFDAARGDHADVWKGLSAERRAEAESIVAAWRDVSRVAAGAAKTWTELTVFVPLDVGGSVVFHGVIDVLALMPDGRAVVVDYKTAKAWNEKSPGELAGDDQMTGYALAASLLLGVPLEKVEVCLVYVRSLRVHRLTFRAPVVAAWARSTVTIGREILEKRPEEAAPAPSRESCRYCEYVGVCPSPDPGAAR